MSIDWFALGINPNDPAEWPLMSALSKELLYVQYIQESKGNE